MVFKYTDKANEASLMDPSQRLFLQTACHALVGSFAVLYQDYKKRTKESHTGANQELDVVQPL